MGKTMEGIEFENKVRMKPKTGGPSPEIL